MNLQQLSFIELREMLITYFGDHMKALLEHDHVMLDKSKNLLSAVLKEMRDRGYEVAL
ncbi:hypothetical protein HWC07_gp062 [Pantoea phage vB_PagM_LIET2]|uniref:Uncharacterized protein n=1 Tax=Pantoea phage vB_PagM_LIET2 TaxID=2508071 RepID=A0A411AW36_9CAUD|nr:hypothetical protein HWC07_gp062 [Pantoea phage vB_PagM_LIET2]QAX92314.1 hypothetical protein LIET2_gp062 [Pantoea phage vB_PagM_LIET2]UJH95961.1 hypothetical protein [Pantoea phage Nafs113]